MRARQEAAEGLAVRVHRPTEPGDRLLKLWLEPGEPGQRGMLAGGWTDPLDAKRIAKDRERFLRSTEVAEPETLDAEQSAPALDALVRRAGELDLALSEGVALVLPQLRRAAGSPDWPDFDVVLGPTRLRRVCPPRAGRISPCPGRVSVRRHPRSSATPPASCAGC